MIFEMVLSNMKRLNHLTKICEAICNHSDTAQIKVKKSGAYIDITDSESFCAVECRIPDKTFQYLQWNDTRSDRWSTKVLLDHLTSELRRAARMKQTVTLFAETTQPDILKIRSVEHTLSIKSTNHRPRLFRVLSTHKFIQQCPEYAHFRLLNAEWTKLINVQCVMSGNHGGVAEMGLEPLPDGRARIWFSIMGHCGSSAEMTIHTHKGSAIAPVVQLPPATIRIRYFLTYLKRCQGLFHSPQDLTHAYLSPAGMLLQTESGETMSTVVFISDVQGVDLDSFV
jgi:hypothetical protein